MRKLKKTLIILAIVAVVGCGGFFGWKYFRQSSAAPVKVLPFSFVGMTEYWGDSRESYGPVSTDKVQTVYLSDTQTVSQVLVKEDQQVKKGDLLMSFDTTLSQLELERKELEIQKNQMDLEDANKELQRISWMVPMGTPPTVPETEPTEPDLGRQLQEEYELFDDGHDGSAESSAFICWIPGGKVITPQLLLELGGWKPDERVRVTFTCTPAELTLSVYPADGDASAAIAAESDGSYLLAPGEYAYQASADGYESTQGSFTVVKQEPLSVEVTLTQSSTEPTATSPTDPTDPSDPTSPTDPTDPTNPTDPTDPTQEPTQAPTEVPTQPAERVQVRFRCTPEGMTLVVFPADKDASSAIAAEVDGSYLLAPGKYAYLASADGYESAQAEFTVPEQTEPVEVTVTLTASTVPSTEESTAPTTEPTQPTTDDPTTVTEDPTAATPAAEQPAEQPTAGENAVELTGVENLIQFAAFDSEDGSPAQPGEDGSCQPYYVVFKITRDNMLKGDILGWIGLHVYSNGSFAFFDASQNEDFSIPVDPEEPTQPEPDMDYIGSGYTYTQIQAMKEEQLQKIKELELSLKLAEAELKIMQKELSDGNIYAEQDGKVISVLTEEEAKLNSQPIIKVTGGGGYYIDASISELERSGMKVGMEVTVNDWDTGATYTGTVVSVGDIPSSSSSYNGMNNPNASSYPFRVFVDENADLQAGNYVSVQYSTGEQTGIYLEKAFLRTENGRSYVYALGEDGLLEQRTVQVGRNLNGYYVEILDGLTEDDMIAFPYGKNVKAGVPAEEGDYSDLYG